eukprot:m.167077 g.167077  ORF g.167077 m.167077 type:complete len:63 (+) comp16446_c2_seq2:159-347(+)
MAFARPHPSSSRRLCRPKVYIVPNAAACISVPRLCGKKAATTRTSNQEPTFFYPGLNLQHIL